MSSSKAALESDVRTLAYELGRRTRTTDRKAAAAAAAAAAVGGGGVVVVRDVIVGKAQEPLLLPPVRVNCISAGPRDTPASRAIFDPTPPTTTPPQNDEEGSSLSSSSEASNKKRKSASTSRSAAAAAAAAVASVPTSFAERAVLYSRANAPLRREEGEGVDDVGNAAVFLLSDMARGITGQTIHVDDGLSVMGLAREGLDFSHYERLLL